MSLRNPIWWAAAIAFGLKLCLAFTTYGSSDVALWEAFRDKAAAEGPLALYREGVVIAPFPFNHPPFMLLMVKAWSGLEGATGLPFRFWLRATGALADFGSVILLVRMGLPAPGILLVCLSPIALMVTGFHGNSDPVLVFFMVLAVAIASRSGAGFAAGLAVGMAVNIKVTGALLAPLLIVLPGARPAALLSGAALAFIGGSLPWIARDPLLVVGNVFGYGSQFGYWGIPRILTLADQAIPALRPLSLAYYLLGRFLIVGLILAFVWRTRRSAAPLIARAGTVMLIFLTFTFGFSVQYLAWLVPWTAALRLNGAVVYHLAGGAFLIAIYTFWCGGLPWNFADAYGHGMPAGKILWLEFAAWGSVLWLLHGALRALDDQHRVQPAERE